MPTLMARGLFKCFNYPDDYFASVGFDSEQFYPVVWEGVEILEELGIRVRVFVSDRASTNINSFVYMMVHIRNMFQ